MSPLNTSCEVIHVGHDTAERSAALGPEEHRAREVVAFGELGGRPSKRTWPFSRKTARSATASATLSDCSTMIIVMPSALSRSTTSSSSCTTSGASPSESSSMASTSGSWISAIASASICCWPPDSCDAAVPSALGELGEQARRRGRARRLEVGVVAAVHERRHLQVLVDGHRREHALAAEQDADPELRPLLGRDVGDGAAVEPHDAASGVPRPGDDAQDRRLAGAVGAEQREHLAASDLEADVEQHLHRAVGEVDVGDLQGRDVRRATPAGAGARPSPRAAPRRPATGRCG